MGIMSLPFNLNKSQSILSPMQPSPPTNLPLRKRRHPGHDDIEPNDHATHDPETLRIVRPMEAEQNRKNHTSKISHSADSTAQHAIGVWVYVRNQGEVCAVAGFEEERHTRDEAEHCRLVLRVEEADSDEEGAGDDADEDDPTFFEPEVGGDVLVEEIADDTS
jgi:hypothetical protein